jgi:DNA-binding NarL/FixJ family response regulator
MNSRLTSRELQILQLVADGHTTPQISKMIYSAEGTIKAQISMVLLKMGASNRAHAVALGYQRGILQVEYQQELLALGEGA